MRRGKKQDSNSALPALPAPRLTGTGVRLLVLYVALPIFGALALMDAALYFFFKHFLSSCYGVWCLF